MRSSKGAACSSTVKLPHSPLAAGVRAALGWRSSIGATALAGAMLLPSMVFAQDQSASPAAEIDEIVVTGRRAALESATERKQNSESIIDSVVADEAGMLPDNSITEVLQRVAGVAIVRFSSLGDPDHFSAEGSGVQVRGLSGVAGRLNGREVFSASGGRGLSWGDVTPELMQAVDVYKASTADLIEGGTGGQIDLRTKLPFDLAGDFNASLSANANYGDLAEEVNPGASLLASKTWEIGNGRFGILADIAYNEYSSNADFFRMEPYQRTRVGTEDVFIPAGYDYGNDAYSRERRGAYLALQWAPTENLTFTQTTFYSKYDETRTGNAVFSTSQNLGVAPGTGVFDDGGFLVQSDNVFQRDTGNFLPSGAPINAGGNTGVAYIQSETLDLSAEFEWAPTERLSMKGALQWVDSTSGRRSYDTFPNIQFPTSFAIDLRGDLPQVSLPAGPNNIANPTTTVWSAVMDNLADNDGELFAANLDFDVNLSDDGFFRTLGFGARYGDRSELDLNSSFNWQALGAGWNGSPVVPFDQSQAGDTEFVNWGDFFRGDLNLPGQVIMPSLAMTGRMDAVRDHNVYGGSPGDAFIFQPWDTTESSTETVSAYVLTRFDSGEKKVLGMQLKGNVGARVVQFENTSAGFFSQSASTFERDGVNYSIAGVAAPVSGSTKTTRVLPSVNLAFLPNDAIQIRLAYNITLDQPSFNALRASGTLGVTTIQNPMGNTLPPLFQRFTTDSGNPFLKPVISHNSDLSFEWYPDRSLTAHVSFFHKSIDNWITYGAVQQPIQVLYIAPTPEVVTEVAESSNYFNAAEKATVKGVEFGGRVFFDKLPAPWDGLGLEANYTYIDSENPGDLYYDIDGVAHDDAPVQGLSQDNLNITAMYEKGPLSLRLAWSWRDKYLQSTNSNGTNGSYNFFSAPGVSLFRDIALPVWGDAYGQLDFGSTWRPNDHLALSLELQNLTNEITRTLMGGYPGGTTERSWFVSDRRANISVRYNF
jgi:iron complex outermembrane recepter protein